MRRFHRRKYPEVFYGQPLKSVTFGSDPGFLKKLRLARIAEALPLDLDRPDAVKLSSGPSNKVCTALFFYVARTRVAAGSSMLADCGALRATSLSCAVPDWADTNVALGRIGLSEKREDIKRLVFAAMDEISEQKTGNPWPEKDEGTLLLPEDGGILDSLGSVNFVVAIEDRIQEEFDQSISLTEESEKLDDDPFYSVERLVSWIDSLLDSE